MSYALHVYPAEARTLQEAGVGLDDPAVTCLTLPPAYLNRLLPRLERYGYQPQPPEGPATHQFTKHFGELPVTVRVYPGEVSFTAPSTPALNANLFNLRMDASELSDTDDVALFDPQAREWNAGADD